MSLNKPESTFFLTQALLSLTSPLAGSSFSSTSSMATMFARPMVVATKKLILSDR